MGDNDNEDDDELAEDIKRILQLSEESSLENSGMTQADRIIDKLSTVEKEVSESNTMMEQNSDRLAELTDSVNELESTEAQREEKLEELTETVEDNFNMVNDELSRIAEKAGVQLPERVSQKLKLSASTSLILFSIISVGITLSEGGQIPLATQITAAVGLGLLIPEVLQFAQ